MDNVNKITEEMLSYVCDEICTHHHEDLKQAELDCKCRKCKLKDFAYQISRHCMDMREQNEMFRQMAITEETKKILMGGFGQ